MATLTINDKDARKIYPTAAPELKTILEETFGKPFFSQKITDRVKSVKDACEVLGIDSDDLYLCNDSDDDTAYKELKTIVKALNEGWTPDWNNSSEYKWYPWFYLNQPGFRLNGVCYYSFSAVGSRLCFKSRELAEYAAKQFESIYKTFFTLQ